MYMMGSTQQIYLYAQHAWYVTTPVGSDGCCRGSIPNGQPPRSTVCCTSINPGLQFSSEKSTFMTFMTVVTLMTLMTRGSSVHLHSWILLLLFLIRCSSRFPGLARFLVPCTSSPLVHQLLLLGQLRGPFAARNAADLHRPGPLRPRDLRA